MKTTLTLLLALSLAANAAFLIRASKSKSADVAMASPTKVAPGTVSKLPADLAAAFASGDAAALKAAGLSDADIRTLMMGKAFSKFATQMRALKQNNAEADSKYWRNSPFNNYNKMTSEQRAAFSKAQRELMEAVRTALGDDADMDPFGGKSYSFLPAAKRNELSRIAQDYNEMMSDVYRDQNGIQLASDQAKLKLLRDEKDRDIAAVLSPEEYEQYQLHDSQTANNIRMRYGDAIQSEDDYKKIYALQKAFDDKYPNDMFSGGMPSQEEMKARSAAQKQLNDDIRAAIGDANYASFLRANDPDYKAITSLQTRLNLPNGTADDVYALRDNYAAQSAAINNDKELTFQQRRDQLNSLATQAKNDLVAKLGQEGADAYSQRSQWVQYLKNGMAFSTNPKDAPSGMMTGSSTVYPVVTKMPSTPRKTTTTAP